MKTMRFTTTLAMAAAALLMALFLLPSQAHAATPIDIEGVVGTAIDKQVTSMVADGHSHKMVITSGQFPDGVSFRNPETAGKYWWYVDGTPTEGGFFSVECDLYDQTTNTKLDSFVINMNITGAPVVTIHTTQSIYSTSEFARIEADVHGGTGSYKYEWFAVLPGTSTQRAVGSDVDYLPYPTSGNLVYDDNGTEIWLYVTDTKTGLSSWCLQPVTIKVQCTHKYSKWTEESAATCTEPQWLMAFCDYCMAPETKEGDPALGHDWGEWAKLDDTTMIHKCSRCPETETQAIVAGTPFLVTQPNGGNIFPEDALKLTFEAQTTGLGDLTYQWFRSEAKDDGLGKAVTGKVSEPAFMATEQGYYYCEVTQTAGNASNKVTTRTVYVHVHSMGEWVADIDAGTVTRECTDPDCPEAESMSIVQFKKAYPDLAEAMGLGNFNMFYQQHALLFWILVVLVVALLGVLIAVAIILIKRNKAAKEAASSMRQAVVEGNRSHVTRTGTHTRR